MEEKAVKPNKDMETIANRLSKLQNIFSTLTPSKTFWLFLFFLVIGFLSIFSNYNSLLIANAVILVYGAILIFCQNKLFIELTFQTKNSPYFLGFIFTLAALFSIFCSSELENINLSLVFRQTGVAISTTILGLILRQAIFNFDPSQEQQADIIRSTAEELRENVNRYREAQGRLFKVIDEFIETREQLLIKEEAISKRYIESLYRGLETFTTIQEKYPDNIEKFFDKLETDFEVFSKSSHEYTQSIYDGINIIQTTISKFPQLIDENSKDLINNFEQLNEKMYEFPDILTNMYNNIKKLESGFEEASNSIQKQAEKFDSELGYRLEQFEKELDSINNIMESFITLMKKYIKK